VISYGPDQTSNHQSLLIECVLSPTFFRKKVYALIQNNYYFLAQLLQDDQTVPHVTLSLRARDAGDKQKAQEISIQNARFKML
jgi:hypothetical protein